MRNLHKSAWALAAISGGLQVLIFPPANLYWLSWVAFAPLVMALLRARAGEVSLAGNEWLCPANPWQALLLGTVSGFIWYAGSIPWIMHVMGVYGGLEGPVVLALFFLFCLACGATQHGVFALVVALVAGGKPGAGIRRGLALAPFAWVAAELERNRIFGFPWDPLGTCQIDNIPLTRVATVTGVYGLSLEIMVVNTAFAAAFLVRRSRRKFLFGAAVTAAIVLQASVFLHPAPSRPTAVARLVQQDIPIDQSWTPEIYQHTIDALRQKSLPAAGEPHADLIIWPESPAPFWVNQRSFRDAVSQIAAQAHSYVIVGTLAISAEVPGKPQQIFNSASLIAPSGQWMARYDKIHLVPFGEFVPFKEILTFAHQLTREVGDFIPGRDRTVFSAGDYKVGTFICYEAIFPEEIRQFAANGGDVFANITNDEWFGPLGAPRQHLNQARMRAVENERWLLRSTNTGITVSIDPYGRVVAQAPRQVFTALDAPFGLVHETTFYSRHGDWFAWLCVIISIGAVLFGRGFRQIRGSRIVSEKS